MGKRAWNFQRSVCLSLGLAFSVLSLGCLERFEEAEDEGAQEQLRDFKESAESALAEIDAKLTRLHLFGGKGGASSSTRVRLDELDGRRDELVERVDALVIDGRSRRDQTQEYIKVQLSELARDVAAADAAMRRID